jgi:hypothetical protein
MAYSGQRSSAQNHKWWWCIDKKSLRLIPVFGRPEPAERRRLGSLNRYLGPE